MSRSTLEIIRWISASTSLPPRTARGSWSARRSLHEGVPFEIWKLGLEREFAETLKVDRVRQAAESVAGNVRGLGAERKVSKRTVDGKGMVEGE